MKWYQFWSIIEIAVGVTLLCVALSMRIIGVPLVGQWMIFFEAAVGTVAFIAGFGSLMSHS